MKAFSSFRSEEDSEGKVVLETPLRKLICSFPEMAIKVLDKCCCEQPQENPEKGSDKVAEPTAEKLETVLHNFTKRTEEIAQKDDQKEKVHLVYDLIEDSSSYHLGIDNSGNIAWVKKENKNGSDSFRKWLTKHLAS